MKRHSEAIHPIYSSEPRQNNYPSVPAIPARLYEHRASRSLFASSSSIVPDAPWERLWADSAALQRSLATTARATEAWMMPMDRATPDAFPQVVDGIVDMLANIAGDLAGGAGAVHAEAIQEEQRTHFIVTVSPSDIEKVIGPRGRTAASLRVIVRAAGIKQNRHFSLSIRSSGSLN